MAAKEVRDQLAEIIEDTRKVLLERKELLGETIELPRQVKGKTPASNARIIAPTATKVAPAVAPALPVPNTDQQYPAEAWTSASSLEDLNNQICNCMKCPLGTTRTKFVFGVGNPNAGIMFVGEGPGADEDRLGEPFVGRAGQLLNKILTAIELKREEVYICNIVKCRPPNNREPLPEEMDTCTPYLYKQIELVKPKFIVCLGRTAAQWLLQTKESLTSLRGRTHVYHGATLIVTYHPAALLRNEAWKRPTWEDMKNLKMLYEQSKKA